MNDSGTRVSAAKLRAATQAFITACDEVDGVKDGLVEEPLRCTFAPKVLVGTDVGGEKFTAADVDVIRRLWEGPRAKDGTFLWYGLNKGADLTAMGSSPFSIGVDWVRCFLIKDPKWDASKITLTDFERLFKQAVDEWGPVFGTDNPDLSKFRDHGGKASGRWNITCRGVSWVE
jgi:hypothetical protein